MERGHVWLHRSLLQWQAKKPSSAKWWDIFNGENGKNDGKMMGKMMSIRFKWFFHDFEVANFQTKPSLFKNFKTLWVLYTVTSCYMDKSWGLYKLYVYIPYIYITQSESLKWSFWKGRLTIDHETLGQNGPEFPGDGIIVIRLFLTSRIVKLFFLYPPGIKHGKVWQRGSFSPLMTFPLNLQTSMYLVELSIATNGSTVALFGSQPVYQIQGPAETVRCPKRLPLAMLDLLDVKSLSLTWYASMVKVALWDSVVPFLAEKCAGWFLSSLHQREGQDLSFTILHHS